MDIQAMSEFIDYNSETGTMIWKKVLSNRTKAGALCGANVDSKGYARVCFAGKQYRAHRVAWALFYGVDPDRQIDHINGDRQDNRIENLRLATNTQNSRNTKLSRNNTSGVTGVTFSTAAQKWIAQITVSRKNVYIGVFPDKVDAIKARKQAESQYFGQFARSPHFELA